MWLVFHQSIAAVGQNCNHRPSTMIFLISRTSAPCQLARVGVLPNDIFFGELQCGCISLERLPWPSLSQQSRQKRFWCWIITWRRLGVVVLANGSQGILEESVELSREGSIELHSLLPNLVILPATAHDAQETVPACTCWLWRPCSWHRPAWMRMWQMLETCSSMGHQGCRCACTNVARHAPGS